MVPSTTGERATAALSALAALVILGAAVTAQQTGSTPRDRVADRESDLRFQLNLAHRLDGALLRTRLAELDEVLAAWARSPRSPQDQAALEAWLDQAIQRTMPGESGALPAAPKFGALTAAQPAVSVPRAAQPALAPQPTLASNPRPTAPTPAPQQALKGPGAPAPGPAGARQPAAPPERSIAVNQPATPRVAAARQPKVPPKALPLPTTASTPIAAPPEPQPADAEEELIIDPPAPGPAAIAVNLVELNARIAGYHAGLQAIESSVVGNRAPLETAALEALVTRLEELAGQRSFVQLYFDTLTDDERESVSQPRPLGSVVDLLLAECAARADRGDDVLSDFESTAADADGPLAARLRKLAQDESELSNAGR